MSGRSSSFVHLVGRWWRPRSSMPLLEVPHLHSWCVPFVLAKKAVGVGWGSKKPRFFFFWNPVFVVYPFFTDEFFPKGFGKRKISGFWRFGGIAWQFLFSVLKRQLITFEMIQKYTSWYQLIYYIYTYVYLYTYTNIYRYTHTHTPINKHHSGRITADSPNVTLRFWWFFLLTTRLKLYS